MKILAFGEVLWDVFPENKYIGGAPLNFAAHFVSCSGEAWMLSAVGNDALGDDTLQRIEKMNVNTEFISRTEKETGKCNVTLDENMIPSYNLLDDVAYDYIQLPEEKCNFDVLYFGTLALRNMHNVKTLTNLTEKNSFGEIFVDMNIRAPFYSDSIIEFALKKATLLKISDEELPVITKAVFNEENPDYINAAKALSKKFNQLKLIIITRGDKGAFAYDCVSENMYECKAQKAEVVSTVGAGDSFCAAFLSKYLGNYDISECLSYASKVSAFVVSKEEAVPSYSGNLLDCKW